MIKVTRKLVTRKTLNCKGNGLASIPLTTVNGNIVNVVVEASFIPEAVLNLLSLSKSKTMVSI